MSVASAKIKFLRVAPRKAMMVADMIRGLKVQEALAILSFSKRHVARDLKKLLNSALANAEQNGGVDPDNLFVKKLTVDQGPTMKRWRARARGSGSRINKKTSHICVTVAER
ncbi:MAG: 50S ribosomal protein L22 [Deltaproteobacteria bacterium]|nr:50S ribosomal protein L22 [Deltaproteobacteria bacterium]